MRQLLLIVFTYVLAGCSSVQTQKAAVSLAAIASSERFQLMVRTGNPIVDKLVYEMAYQQFSSVLPIREQGPFTGVMEITFASTDQGWSVGSSSSVGSGTAFASGWYSGGNYIGGTATAMGSTTTVSSSSTFKWQNSVMLITLKKEDGERLWTADYNYKGGWEMSGWVVNTPEEAARLVLRRLREKFKTDFGK